MTPSVLILDKGGRKYVFRYTPGCERVVMDHLWRLAEDARSGLDWLDAAMLSFQIVCQTIWTPVAPSRTEAKKPYEANR
jgi:hypothetical protein